jgi:16S rRNA (uracil1498-N3)-methyltransferase
MPRLYSPAPLVAGAVLALPPSAARHVQVLRLQPGDGVVLFDGSGGEWQAAIERMGRSDVTVRVLEHVPVAREPARDVHLALGMPGNERMDWLVEKAAELGAASIQPLVTERAIVRLAGERAARKREHWQAVAAAACEQCGGNRVPAVHEPVAFTQWSPPADAARWLLSFAPDAQPLHAVRGGPLVLLSGPEGGLTPQEESAARAAGFRPLTLGPRVLRAETAPLAALAAFTLIPQETTG